MRARRETHLADSLCTCSRSPRRRKESAAHKASRAAAAAAEAVAQAAAATAEKAKLRKFGDVTNTVQALADEHNQTKANVPTWKKITVDEQWRSCSVHLIEEGASRGILLAEVTSGDTIFVRAQPLEKYFQMQEPEFLAMVRTQRQNKQGGKR